MSACPYCGGVDFYVDGLGDRNGLGDVDTEWNNQCLACGKWSVHADSDRSTHKLVDPSDPTSDRVD